MDNNFGLTKPAENTKRLCMTLSESFWAYLRRRMGYLRPSTAKIERLTILSRYNLKIERRAAFLANQTLDGVPDEKVWTLKRNQFRH